MRESRIEKYFVKVVKSLGGEVRKVKWIGRRNAPDRVAMFPCRTKDSVGDTFWVELKATGEGPTTGQLREHRRMRKMGQQVYVFNSIGGIDKWAHGYAQSRVSHRI